MQLKASRLAFKVALIYIIVAGCWILFSDKVVESFVSDPAKLIHVSILKGWLFVIVTAGLLHQLLSHWLKRWGREVEQRRLAETARQTANEKLRRNEEQLRLVMEAVADGLWDWNLKSGAVYLSPRYGEITGEPPGEVPGCMGLVKRLVHPDDFPVIQESLQKHFEGKTPQAVDEFRIITREGAEKWILARGRVVERAPDGTPLRMAGTISDITSRKRAEQEMLHSEERYQALFDRSLDCVFLTDFEGNFLDANRAALDLLGYERKDIASLNFAALLTEDQLPLAFRTAEEIRTTGLQKRRTEYRLRCKDGGEVRVETQGSLIYRDGKPHAILGIGRDITKRYQAEQALIQSKQHYRNLFQHMNEGFAYCQMIFESGRPVDFIYLAVNPMFTTLTGLKDVTGRRVTEVIPGVHESDPELLEMFGRVAATGKPEQCERFVRALQMWFDLSVYSTEPDFFVVVFDVITDRKLAEQKLRDSEERYRKLFEVETDAIFLVDCDTGRFMDANPAAEKMYGWSREEFLKMRPENISEDPFATRAFIAGASQDTAFRRHRKKDGSVFPVEITGTLIEFQGRKIHLGTIRDITSRRAAAERMNLQLSALAATDNAIVITNSAGTIEWVNPAFTRLTGYQAHEAIGGNPRVLKSGQHPPEFYTDMWRRITEGKVWHGELVNKHKDGQFYNEDMTITPVRDAAARITHFVAVKQNVTERRLLENRLQQAQKMEAVGTLAGGIAHDFNNILTAIFGYGYLLQQDVAGNPGTQDKVAEILKSAERAKDLVQQILTFSRKREQHREVIRLDTVIKEAMKFLRASLPADIRIEVKLDPSAPTVLADPTQIYQVVINLATNALHAMEGGPGRLDVTLEMFQPDAAFIAAQPELRPIQYARLTVADTGKGMAEKTLKRIFEPFFTTKPAGKGTGLGLAVVHGIVQSHDGVITVESQTGKGSTFRLYFPAQQGAALAGSATEKITGGTGQRILLVDDETALTTMFERLLSRLNYQVTTSNSAREAVRIFRENPDQYDLVITDLTMPEMNGMDVAREIRDVRPDLPVILSSGFSSAITREALREAGICELIEKPVSMNALADVLQRILTKA